MPGFYNNSLACIIVLVSALHAIAAFSFDESSSVTPDQMRSRGQEASKHLKSICSIPGNQVLGQSSWTSCIAAATPGITRCVDSLNGSHLVGTVLNKTGLLGIQSIGKTIYEEGLFGPQVALNTARQDLINGCSLNPYPTKCRNNIETSYQSVIKSGCISQVKRWPKGVIPYEIKIEIASTLPLYLPYFNDDIQSATDAIRLSINNIQAAIDSIDKETAITFRKREEFDENYVTFQIAEGTSSAGVGMRGKQQFVGYSPIAAWSSERQGERLHEIGHAIGLHHIHQRPDSSQFITIHADCVATGMDKNFDPLAPLPEQMRTFFDFESVMLYNSDTFSKDKAKCPTMTKKEDGSIFKGFGDINGGHLSAIDKQMINEIATAP